MSDVTEFRKLAARFSRFESKITEFPSGAAMLDLTINGIHYTAELLPALNGYGLSRTDHATFGWEGVDEAFATCEELEAAIEALCSAQAPSQENER
jgi:hypothetical protein